MTLSTTKAGEGCVFSPAVVQCPYLFGKEDGPMGADRSRIWMPLDNAALIFPAIRRRNWNNVFRESVTLTEDVDPALLQQAVDELMPRFPSFYLRLRQGVFWYYLEQVAEAPKIREEYSYPTQKGFFCLLSGMETKFTLKP